MRNPHQSELDPGIFHFLFNLLLFKGQFPAAQVISRSRSQQDTKYVYIVRQREREREREREERPRQREE